MAEIEKRAKGRPPENLYEKYEIEKEREVLLAMLRRGATDQQVFEYLGISKTVFYEIKKEYPVFAELIKEGRVKAVMFVENALFKAACGYEVEEVTTEVRVNPDGSGQTTMVKKTKKHIAPQLGAQAFFLKNRASDLWKDKQSMEHNFGEGTGEITLVVKGSKSNLLEPDKI